MVKREYKRNANSNYLVLQGDKEIQENDYQIAMLTNNSFQHLLPAKFRVLDNEFQFLYQIQSKQSLSRIFEKKRIGYTELMNIVKGIQGAAREIENHLLELDCLWMEPEDIYYSLETGTVYFCYLPNLESDFEKEFRRFAEFILGKLNHKEEIGVTLGYELYQCTFENTYEIKNLIYKLENCMQVNRMIGEHAENAKETFEDTKAIGIESSEGKEAAKLDKVHKRKKRATEIKKHTFIPFSIKKAGVFWKLFKPGKKSESKEKYVFLSEEDSSQNSIRNRTELDENTLGEKNSSEETMHGETQLLGEYAESIPKRLISMQNSQCQIEITEYPFVFGKMAAGKESVPDNRSISRIHASIQYLENKYWLTDMNSKNGTFLNGDILEVNETKELKKGNRIKFGDQEYLFQ